MGKFILYTVLGTAAAFAVIVHVSLLPHLLKLPSFANGITSTAVLTELPAFLTTLGMSWIIWWGVSGLFCVLLYSIGKYSSIVLFLLSLASIYGITELIT